MNSYSRARKSAQSLAVVGVLSGLVLLADAGRVEAAANPKLPFYGYNAIVPSPNPAIVNQNTSIAVSVENDGDATATNVGVAVNYNDWGVTFSGWQPIGTANIPSIAAAATETTSFNFTFLNRAHTCVEAIITGASENGNIDDDRGQINLEVVDSAGSFQYDVPVRNRGAGPRIVDVGGECDGDGLIVECNIPPRNGMPLPPGQEIMLPIQVEFPPGAAIGSQVEIIVAAADTSDPNDAANQEHVRFIVNLTTARAAKEAARDELEALLGELPTEKLEKPLVKAITKINESLASHAWQTDSSVGLDGGGKVFAKEGAAVATLIKLADGLSMGSALVTIEAAMQSLVNADRILVESALGEASGDTTAAEAALQAADALWRAGNLKDAIKGYKEAWELARAAL